jgi:DeoR/GlpR family transcriptional regulator of sugar metabolism
MILKQRQQQIAELIREFRSSQVERLGEEFDVSSPTDIRRLR